MLETSRDIKNPGLRILPPGVERYFVKGGGLSAIEVSPEDKIEIINEEGKQICEVIVFLEKSALEFSFKFKIDKSDLPFELKTIISQICLPSSLMISILSSGETSIIERPPPFTKYLSTPGGKVLKPGFLISLLVCSIASINLNNLGLT